MMYKKTTLKVAFGLLAGLVTVVAVPLLVVSLGIKWFAEGSVDGVTHIHNLIRSM